MKIYIDCEFLEDGRTIELISIGMIADDGRELYAVNDEVASDPLYTEICKDRWLMENVVPGLPLTAPGSANPYGRWEATRRGFFHLDLDSNVVMPKRMIRNAVRDFILATPDVELWAWYGAYDHVALAQLWGRLVDLPAGIPIWTNNLRQEAARLGDPPMPEQADGVHNALADARHNKVRAEALAAFALGLPVVTEVKG